MKSVLFVFCVMMMLIPSLGLASSLTKTVGVGQDYTTIADALADINTNGLADTVSLMLMDTLYNESALMYNPTTSQPASLYMFQGGAAKPHVRVTTGGLPYAFMAVNHAEFVMYNISIEPDVSTSWLAGVNVRSMEEDSRVYIQSGGVTGSTTQRGYEVLADSSSEVNIFGCLVINVQSVGIYIELQNFALASVAGIKGFASSPTGASEIRLNGNTITDADTGIIMRSASGPMSTTTAQADSNTFDNVSQAIEFDNIAAGVISFSHNTVAAQPYYDTYRQVMNKIGAILAAGRKSSGSASPTNNQFNVNGNLFEVGAVTGSIIEVDVSGYDVTCSNNTMRSTSLSPLGVNIASLQGMNSKYTSEGNVISGFDIGTLLDGIGEFAEIQINGNADTVASKAIYLPNGHNVAVFEVGSSAFSTSSMRTRYRAVSLEKFASAKSGSMSPTSDQIAIDVTINNDPGVTSSVNVSNVDFDWTNKAIDIKGNFEGEVETGGNNIALSGNLGNADEIGIHVRGLWGDNSSFTSNVDVINPANKGIVLDSLDGGTVRIGGCDITAGSSAIEATGKYVSSRRLVIYIRESIDLRFSPSMTRLRAVSLRKAAIAKGAPMNSYDPSSAIMLSVHTDSCEVTIENGDIDWIGDGIVLNASPLTNFNFNNLGINLNNSGGTTAMQYRAKRSEVIPNLDGIKTAELNNIQNAGRGMYFELQPYSGSPGGGLMVSNNTISNCATGVDVMLDNDTTGGVPGTELQFPSLEFQSNVIGEVGAIAIPNFVAMQYRAKRSEVPPNIDAIKVEKNTIDGGGSGLSGIDFQFYPGGPVEIDSNEISGCRSNFQLGSLAFEDFINDHSWAGEALSITHNTFNGGGLDLDVVGHALTLQNNMFTCTGGGGLSNSLMPGNRYELQVRSSNRVRLASNSARPDFAILLGGNTFCDGDLIVDIANDDTADVAMSTSITDNQANGNVTITTYDTETEITGNTFGSGSALSSSAMATNRYELQFRKSTRFNLANTAQNLNKSVGASLTFKSNDLNGFNEVIISIDDTSETGSVLIDSNNVTAVGGAASSLMPANRYEVSFKKSKAVTLATSHTAHVSASSFEYSNNSVTGYSDVIVDLEDSSETLSASIMNNNFNNTGSLSASSSLPANRYEVSFKKSKTITLASSNSLSGSMSSFVYDSNSVSGYSNVAFDLDDETGLQSSSLSGNTIAAVGSVTGLHASAAMWGNKLEVNIRRGSRLNLISSLNKGTLAPVTGEWFVFENNTVSGFSDGGLFDVENNGDAGTARFEGNTVSSVAVPATAKPGNAVMMPVGKYELNVRRANRHLGATHPSVTPGDSLIVRNNNFTGLDGGGFFVNSDNNASGEMSIWLDGNTFSSTSSPFFFDVSEAPYDSGSSQFLFTGNIVHGGTQSSDVMDARYNLLLGAMSTTKPNIIKNGQGLVFYGTPVEPIKFNYQNVVGNSMNIVNRTNAQIDARYCWWGTTNRAEIAAKMEGDVLFEPFLTDSVLATVGSISGVVYLDADANYTKDSFEMELAGQEVTLWQNDTQIAADTTDGAGAYSFTNLPLGTYFVQLSIIDGYVGTENDDGATVDFISGGAVEENFGTYQELQRFRTFKADTALSRKPVKIVFKGNVMTSAYPNTATALENVFARLGKNGATFLGVPQTDKNRAKRFAWLVYKKAADLGKFYTSAHTGLSYPIDSLRPAGKKAKALKGAIKADRKTYNNPAWEQGVAFNLNIMASALGVTPVGFGELVVEADVSVGGRALQGMTLAEVAEWYNELLTYWDSLGIDNSSGYYDIDEFAVMFLKSLNDGFSAGVTPANSAIDTTAVKTGDIHVTGNKKNAFAVTLAGVATASEVGLVEYVPGIAPKVVVYDAGYSEESEVPVNFGLHQNYPNPFNPSTQLSFDITQPAFITLKVYDMLGREVATLLQREEMEEGNHSLMFDASSLSSGMYFYRLTATSLEGGETVTDVKRMALVK